MMMETEELLLAQEELHGIGQLVQQEVVVIQQLGNTTIRHQLLELITMLV